MARKRKPDEVDIHKQQRSRRRLHAPIVKEEFPSVCHVQVHLTFEDFDQKAALESRELNYSPESKAFFELECPYWECVLGGFNFSGPVRQAVRERQTNATGTEQCPGWQDRERINKHRCYLKAHYQISIKYFDDGQ